MATRSASGLLNDYKNLNTVPAMLSVAYIAASLYQFGGISTIDLVWLNYQLTTQATLVVSLGAFVVAFASSETKNFSYYEQWEQITIAAGPGLILGYEYVTQVTDLISGAGQTGQIVAFLVVCASWAVAVR